MKNVVEAEKICKRFRGRSILEQLSFSWNSGIYCLHGKNGRGKSTLLRILAGAERDFNGSLKIHGQDAVKSPDVVNRFRSFLPDHPNFYPKATTKDLLSFVASVRKIDHKKLLHEAVDQYGLDELLAKPLERQSLGQRKRSFFGAILLKKVPLWILDEPTNGLDDYYQAIFFEQVKNHVADGGTVIIATHDLAMAARLNANALCLFPEAAVQPVTELRPTHGSHA